MGRFLTLGGLGKVWDNIKGRLMPPAECAHINISSPVNISWCINSMTHDYIECCRDAGENQNIYICKDCGRIKVVNATIGDCECCGSEEEAIWNNNLNQWVDPTVFIPWNVIRQDPLYTAQYTGTTIKNNNTDYVIEIGTINNWTYQKWNNGMIELYQNYYSSKDFANGTSGNNIVLLVVKDTDNFSFTPLTSFTTGGLAGHNTPIVEYSRVAYSSSMSTSQISEPGYYLDTYIYCPNGPYTGVPFWLRPYIVGTWK